MCVQLRKNQLLIGSSSARTTPHLEVEISTVDEKKNDCGAPGDCQKTGLSFPVRHRGFHERVIKLRLRRMIRSRNHQRCEKKGQGIVEESCNSNALMHVKVISFGYSVSQLQVFLILRTYGCGSESKESSISEKP